jgi:hypothetical protein
MILLAFKEYCPLLKGSPHTIKVISNHRNLTYFIIHHLLNYHQTQWSKFPLYLKFKIDYRPGKVYSKVDTYTYYEQGSGEDSNLQEVYHTQTSLKAYNLSSLVNILLPNGGFTFYDLLLTTYEADTLPSEILQMLQDRRSYSKQISLRE